MKTQEYLLQLYKQLSGRLDQKASTELDRISADPSRKEDHSALKRIWELSGSYGEDHQPDVEAGLRRFRQRTGADHRRVVRLRRRRWLAIAASFLLLLTAAFWWWEGSADEPLLLQATTGGGEQLTVELADGTKIILNEHSRLTYPSSFAGQDQREVTLNGEAFFEVASDQQHPFAVHTDQMEVTVLGTSFNLRVYPGEGFSEIEVYSGHVEVRGGKQVMEVIPKERVTYDYGGRMWKEQLTDLNAASWQTGRLQFRKAPLKEVIHALERHYQLTIDLENGQLADCTFNGNFQETEIGETLETLAIIFQAEIEAVGPGHYRIRRGHCR